MAWPSGKAEACKASIPQFESGCHLSFSRLIVLYLVATPIGNLEDITIRAIRVLQECDLILAEDTRHSKHLLETYHIKTRLESFHQFNEKKKENAVIELLKEGKALCLISDAGTPSISDPGWHLVHRCHQEEILVSIIPGPCALISALAASGLAPIPFQFFGFLPKTTVNLKQQLQKALSYPGTTICYEAPHRLLTMLSTLSELAPQRRVVVARELTKRHESIVVKLAHNMYEHFKTQPVQGELVVLIEGRSAEEPSTLPCTHEILEAVQNIRHNMNCNLSDAVKIYSQSKGFNKKEIYQLIRRSEKMEEV